MSGKSAAVEQQLLGAVEKELDSIMERFNNLDTEDLTQLRANRIAEMKRAEQQRKEWLALGHGQYEYVTEEKQFFNVIRQSERCVLHFYTRSTPRCDILEKHLKILAGKHVETRFVAFDAEKCPFLADRLRVKTIPTLVMIKNSVMLDKIIGFSELGNRDDFTTETLEWRLATGDMLDYEGDLGAPPSAGDNRQQKPSGNEKKKTIRSSAFKDDDNDDLDIEEEGIKRESLVKQHQQQIELTAEEANELGI